MSSNPGWLLPTFKAVSVIFAFAAVYTGGQALLDPIGFAKSFGIPAPPTTTYDHSLMAYVALMGVRQLGTGVTLLAFAYQGNWKAAATLLAIIGILVAGTDGIYLARLGTMSLGLFHAGPGALIAALGAAVVWYEGDRGSRTVRKPLPSAARR